MDEMVGAYGRPPGWPQGGRAHGLRSGSRVGVR